MKKIIALLLALAMCLSLVACGAGSADKADTPAKAEGEKKSIIFFCLDNFLPLAAILKSLLI